MKGGVAARTTPDAEDTHLTGTAVARDLLRCVGAPSASKVREVVARALRVRRAQSGREILRCYWAPSRTLPSWRRCLLRHVP